MHGRKAVTDAHHAGKATMNGEPAALSVVIVNYDTWDDVLAQVSTLSRTPEFLSGRVEVLVVDNDSPTPPPKERPCLPGLKWIDRADNGGFAAGVNAGWSAARGEWLLVMNPDVVVTDVLMGHVLALLDEIDSRQTLADQPRVGVMGIALTNPDGSRQPSVGAFPSVGRGVMELFIPRSRRRYQIVSPRKFGPVDWVTGAFFLVRSQVMRELGGFDEDYFLYFEETDFCRRAWRAGWGAYFVPHLSACHQKPLQNRRVSPKIRLLTRHSRLVYFRKNASGLQFRLMLALVKADATLRWLAARLGLGSDDPRVWKAIRKVTDAFRKGQEPLGTDVRDWAVRTLADPS
jgi:GT2 family glycosyltransferase